MFIYLLLLFFFFFFNDTATTEIYTLSLHDALPICDVEHVRADDDADTRIVVPGHDRRDCGRDLRSVGAERRHDPEQRLGEAEPLADPVELPRQHQARRDRDDEP